MTVIGREDNSLWVTPKVQNDQRPTDDGNW